MGRLLVDKFITGCTSCRCCPAPPWALRQPTSNCRCSPRMGSTLATGVSGAGQVITNLWQAMNETSRVADDLTSLIGTANAPIFGIVAESWVMERTLMAAAISGWDWADTMGKLPVESSLPITGWR